MRISGAIKAECGMNRCRNRRRIQEHMDRRGLNGVELARRIGVTPEAVYRTLSGTLHSPAVLDALRSIGVEERYLFDPRRMAPVGKEAAA